MMQKGTKTTERPLRDYLAEVCERMQIRRGGPLPMGIHEYGSGVNFAFFRRKASRVRLKPSARRRAILY
jgi:hypothetical protein